VLQTQATLLEKPLTFRCKAETKDTLLLTPLSKQDSVGWGLQNLLFIATMMKPNPIQSGHTNTVGSTLWTRKSSKTHK